MAARSGGPSRRRPAPAHAGDGLPADGRSRVIIEAVSPEIDCGRHPIKRVPGETVTVTAIAFADGHDVVSAALLHRDASDRTWREVPMRVLPNDRFEASFDVSGLGRERYSVVAWIDRYATWSRDLAKKRAAEQDLSIDLLAGAELTEAASKRAKGPDRAKLERWTERLRTAAEGGDDAEPDDELELLMARYSERVHAVEYVRELEVVVDAEKARYSTWYELFPRSASPDNSRHGTFADVEARLPEIARMGFDVLYLPPIHPIGHTNRKGKNNTTESEPGDPGSPWAIGSEDGGHTSVHPDLGTMEEFERLVRAARSYDIDVAIDIAFQCSPDHPYVKEHPEWFRKRPDGSIQYAENPPKKYQDIYPLDFESEAWQDLWHELRDVVLFWAARGIRIFRVDNPHTKSLRFWEWMIAEVRAQHPDVVFLSDAFTRPAVMYHLAKIGFDQSYTYFTWRVSKRDLTEYLTELTTTDVREYFRPNFWPNTPDILPEHLQFGGRPAFMQRLILAATLGTSYGIYGPAFELLDHEPIAPGKEEYLHSEKYEIKSWDIDSPDSLADLIALVNRVRKENVALQRYDELRFLETQNEMLLGYLRADRDRSNVLAIVVNIDVRWRQSGWLHLPLADLGIEEDRQYAVHDLLTGARYLWRGSVNFVELDPHSLPAHILRIDHGPHDERESESYS